MFRLTTRGTIEGRMLASNERKLAIEQAAMRSNSVGDSTMLLGVGVRRLHGLHFI